MKQRTGCSCWMPLSVSKLRVLVYVVLLTWLVVRFLYLLAPPPPRTAPLRQQASHFVKIVPALFIRTSSWLRGSCFPQGQASFPSEGMAPPRIAIVMGHTNQRKGYANRCMNRAAEYARKQGYDLIQANHLMLGKQGTLHSGSDWHWLKLEAVREVMEMRDRSLSSKGTTDGEEDASIKPRYDWAVWMDSDLWIANMDIRLEDFLPHRQPPENTQTKIVEEEEEAVMVVSKDDEGINSGIWLLRNNAKGMELLDEWRSYQGRPGFPRDQRALRLIYNLRALSRREDRTNRIEELMRKGTGEGTTTSEQAPGFLVHTQCAMNSTPSLTTWDGVFMYGDFVVHFFGFPSWRKEFCIDAMESGNLLVCL